MAFCVEAFRKNKWKIIKETIVSSKDEAERIKDSLLESCVKEEDRFLLVKEKYRIRRLRQKEVDLLIKKESSDDEITFSNDSSV